MTDQELKDLVASLAIQAEKFGKEQEKRNKLEEKRNKEQEKRNKELAKGRAELKESQRQTDEQMKRTDEQMNRTDEQMKRNAELMKKSDEKLARMGIHLAGISTNQGDVAEEYFINSLKNKSLKIADLNFDMLVANMEVSRGGKHDEYDIILVNGESLAIIEVKYKVHPKDLDKLDKKVISIKELSPVYKDFKVYAGVAGFKIPHDVKTKALDRGYFVLERKGDIVETYAKELKVA